MDRVCKLHSTCVQSSIATFLLPELEVRLCVLTLGNSSPRVYFTDSHDSLENSGPAALGIEQCIKVKAGMK